MQSTPLDAILQIFLCVWFALWSYILNRPIHGHRLRIKRLLLFGVHGVRYQGALHNRSYAFSFTASSITWRPRLPQSENPCWLTVTAQDVLYTSSTGDISTQMVHSDLWFFPVLFRFTAGPWANVTVDRLRIRVHKSTATPYYVQRMRENLVSTFLTGEFLRADVFRTGLQFAGLSEHQEDKPTAYTDPRTTLAPDEPDSDEEPCGCCSLPQSRGSNGFATYAHQEEADAFARADEYKTGPLRVGDDEELRFSVVARGVHINNKEGRIYTFGRADSQMRRNWAADRGSFAMVAEECRWVRVHYPFERVASNRWFTQLISSLLQFPFDLLQALSSPVDSVNLYVTRVDVTFDSFRLRDAELVRQGISLVREKAIKSRIDWSDVFFDALVDAFAVREHAGAE
ncbi:hypothetical protein C8Q78DRAFT_1076941 [Trametes maxima]|nr:hypothetical protein C8Q78DRAFT_1076941 [Trametes maxima]